MAATTIMSAASMWATFFSWIELIDDFKKFTGRNHFDLSSDRGNNQR